MKIDVEQPPQLYFLKLESSCLFLHSTLSKLTNRMHYSFRFILTSPSLRQQISFFLGGQLFPDFKQTYTAISINVFSTEVKQRASKLFHHFLSAAAPDHEVPAVIPFSALMPRKIKTIRLQRGHIHLKRKIKTTIQCHAQRRN